MKLCPVFLSVIIFSLISCAKPPLAHHFDFDVMLPMGGVRISEIFPYQIKKMQQRLTKLDLPENMFGMKAFYGKDEKSEEITMAVIQAKKAEDAEEYYESEMEPLFLDKKFVKSPVDNWEKSVYSRDEDGRQYLVWNNQAWIIELSASDDVYFQTVVQACRFVDLID
ncbi:MAG: hypothetical protein JXR70_10615 [Spirochaetales bacterium]|nr:hypothetical protein [Spirochaetales bacterium]